MLERKGFSVHGRKMIQSNWKDVHCEYFSASLERRVLAVSIVVVDMCGSKRVFSSTEDQWLHYICLYSILVDSLSQRTSAFTILIQTFCQNKSQT